ncbi:MAG: hypothetical protein KAQ90_06855, partial [Melioribacteraceae bacterium]|nr:hypothetical protein [Melioribacteraceae bacterium]
FPEDKFFDIIVKMTYPEIEDFINNYIGGSEPLPYVEYMAKLGFAYTEEKISDDTRPTFGTNITVNENGELILIGISDEARKFGMADRDVIVMVLEEEVTMKTARGIVQKMYEMNVGDPYEMVVRRDGEEITLNCVLLQRKTRHVFEDMKELTPEQQAFRDSWIKNLER